MPELKKGMEALQLYTTSYLNGEMTVREWRSRAIITLSTIEDERDLCKIALAIDLIRRRGL